MATSHGHGAAAPVAHHFDNLRQQQAAVRFGMWLFLITEVMFFGGAFCAYTAYRYWFPREFEAGSAALNAGIALVNTFLLLTSSFTMTLAIRAAYTANRGALKGWLLLTLVLGGTFLGLKAREYQLDYEEGLIPSREVVSYEKDGLKVTEPVFLGNLRHKLKEVGHEYREVGPHHGSPNEASPSADPTVDLTKVQLFFMFYYSMTGLHVLHMIIGLGLLVWQYVLAARGFFDYGERYVYVEVMSLYWHFVDMVWMFLMPMLYLAGPHSFGQAREQFMHALGMAAGAH